MKGTIRRSLQREWAVQVLYLMQMTDLGFEKAWSDFLHLQPEAANALYARFLVGGVLAKKDRLDAVINGYLKDWRLDRLSRVDLNILRLGIFELESCPDIPGVVAVNEAIELAKAFSGAEAGKFVNGVLGRYLEEKNRKSDA